jgi:hypothetical protein
MLGSSLHCTCEYCSFLILQEREGKKQGPNGCEALSPPSTMGNQLMRHFAHGCVIFGVPCCPHTHFSSRQR